MILNYYENKIIKNALLPAEWKSQESLDELLNFLQSNWEQRAIFYDDGKVNSKQQFLDFIGQKNIRTKDYVGTIVYKGHQLNIFPKVFKEFKDDDDRKSLDLQHLMHNLVKWIEYTAKIDYGSVFYYADHAGRKGETQQGTGQVPCGTSTKDGAEVALSRGTKVGAYRCSS
ncbi:hypothetical protein JQM63_09505 [Oscillibacter valericigenes]|nr:hypothetical protein [Oscillibacter valericigenes]